MKYILLPRVSVSLALFTLCLLLLTVPAPSAAQAQPATHNATCAADTSAFSDAEIDMYHGDFKKADTLLTAAMAANPTDDRSRFLEITALIGQKKITEAEKAVEGWTATNSNDAYAILSAANVHFAKGEWLTAYALSLKSLKVNPCLADAYENLSQYESSAGYRDTASKHIALAHTLAPNDQSIRIEWIDSLPRAEYLAQLQLFVNDTKVLDEKRRKKAQLSLEKAAGAEENQCNLVSVKGPAVIPMTPIFEDEVGIKSWGLEIAFNGKKRTLQIDTGASGFTLTQSAGANLGLPRLRHGGVGGFGDEGGVGTVVAKAASLQIGGLQFKDCVVDVLDRTGIMGGASSMVPGQRLDSTDGLVGTDIFDRYLVTLDYIKHEIRLAPLPQPPTSTVATSQLDALGGATVPDWMEVDRFVAPSMKSWTSIYREGHFLIMPTRLSNAKGETSSDFFILDTGSDSNIIDVETAKRLTEANENTNVSFGGLSGRVKKVFEAGQFTVDFAGLRLPIKSMDAFDLAIFGGVSGFLGYPTLSQLVMHIDYRDNLVMFEAPNGKKM